MNNPNKVDWLLEEVFQLQSTILFIINLNMRKRAFSFINILLVVLLLFMSLLKSNKKKNLTCFYE